LLKEEIHKELPKNLEEKTPLHKLNDEIANLQQENKELEGRLTSSGPGETSQ